MTRHAPRKAGQEWALRASKIGVAVVALSLAACAPDSEEPERPAHPIFAETIANARDGGASEHQIEVLEEARAQGELTYAMFSELLDNSFQCLDDLGMGYERFDHEPIPGFVVPVGNIFSNPSLGSDQGLMLSDACFEEHSEFASTLYWGQPIVGEIADNVLMENRAHAISCLADHRVSVSAVATPDELRQLSLELDTTFVDREEYPPLCAEISP